MILEDSAGTKTGKLLIIYYLKATRRRRTKRSHKFVYFPVKNNSFAHFTRAFFIFTFQFFQRLELTSFSVLVTKNLHFFLSMPNRPHQLHSDVLFKFDERGHNPALNSNLIQRDSSFLFSFPTYCSAFLSSNLTKRGSKPASNSNFHPGRFFLQVFTRLSEGKVRVEFSVSFFLCVHQQITVRSLTCMYDD